MYRSDRSSPKEATVTRQFKRIAITVKGPCLKKSHAQPGMPAQVLIETGELTVMDYILEPVLVNFETALKEGA